MNKAYTIKVTKSDIAKGIKKNGENCPIALAARRVMPSRLDYVSTFALMTGENYFELPGKAKTFVRAFDAGKPVKPFTFTISSAGL